MRDRGLGGGAATSPSERRGEARQSGGARCTLKYCYTVLGTGSTWHLEARQSGRAR